MKCISSQFPSISHWLPMFLGLNTVLSIKPNAAFMSKAFTLECSFIFADMLIKLLFRAGAEWPWKNPSIVSMRKVVMWKCIWLSMTQLINVFDNLGVDWLANSWLHSMHWAFYHFVWWTPVLKLRVQLGQRQKQLCSMHLQHQTWNVIILQIMNMSNWFRTSSISPPIPTASASCLLLFHVCQYWSLIQTWW